MLFSAWTLTGFSQAPEPEDNAAFDVIVRFKPFAKTAAHQNLLRRGGLHKGTLNLIGSSVYSVTKSEFENLRNNPSVDMVELDRQVEATAFTGTPDYGWTTVFKAGKSTGFNYDYTGKDVTIAVIDSGVGLTGVDLLARVVRQESFVPNELAFTDTYGHGTHVAGIVAGNGSL